MSIVIGLKDKDTIYMACDALSTTALKYYSTQHKSHKIRVLNTNPPVLIGNVGTAKNSQLNGMLADVFKAPDQQSLYRFMVEDVYNKLVKFQSDYRVQSDKTYPNILEGSRMIAFHNRLFITQESNDGGMMEVSQYATMGSASPLAMGSLVSTEGMDPLDRLEKALRVCEMYETSVGAPFYVFSTTDQNVMTIQPSTQIEMETFPAKESV